MSRAWQNIFWSLIRPLHAPLTRRLRARLGRNYATHPEMVLPPAYEAIQLEAERRLHDYFGVNASSIRNVVIVGAHEGNEIQRMQKSYSSAEFLCFEPILTYFRRLELKYAGQDRVVCRQLALSDQPGIAQFYELEVEGTGSLLEPDLEVWNRQCQQSLPPPQVLNVSVSTLDEECAKIPTLDLLWMDVQGAEMRVLSGGKQTLCRTRTVLAEVWLGETAYKGAAHFEQLAEYLKSYGFECCGLGLDPRNFTGNALFIRLDLPLRAKPADR